MKLCRILFLYYFYNIVNTLSYLQNLHLTLQVTDVLRLRIRACVARPATAKCGGRKLHKGACADYNFLEPEPPEWAVSSYRLLSDAHALILLYILIQILQNIFNT